MKKIAKLLSVLAIVAMLVSSVPTFVVANAETAVYQSELSELEQAIYDGYTNVSSSIILRSYKATYSDVQAAVEGVFKKCPDIFYVSKTIALSISQDGTVNSVIPEYIYDADGIEAAKKELEAAVAEIMGDFSDSMTDVQKMLLIHDRVIFNAHYNITGLNSDTLTDEDFTSYGVLVKKTGVCESYAKAFKYCADRCGIKSEIVTSSDHMWNQVYLDGKWYNVDLTHDDPTPDLFSNVKHTHFLFSDEKAKKTLGYTSAYETNGADDTLYDDAFWTKSISSFFMAGDVCVYSNGDDGTICTYDFNTGAKTTLVTLTTANRWKLSSGSNTYYVTYYCRPFYYNGYIYYNTPKEICTIRPDGTGNSIIYTYSVDDCQIYGLGYYNGVPSFTVRTAPSAADNIIPLSNTTKILTAINVTSQPDKTVYLTGEAIDLSGITVTASYSDGSTFDLIDSDYTVSSFDSSTVGKKQLTVSYGSKTCPLYLSVVDNGDLDSDYTVTSSDLLVLQQHFLAVNTLSPDMIFVADFDKNNIIDAADLSVLQTKILGIF